MSIGRLFRTVSYLKPIQIYGRLRLHLPRPKPALHPAPPKRSGLREKWTAPVTHEQSFFPPDRFVFLGTEWGLGEIGWDCPRVPKLWRYNLHYFDDLRGKGSDARTREHRALIKRWIREVTRFAGTAWEPYPLSRRIVNWIRWDLAGNDLDEEQRTSLAIQARWLEDRLEIHLLGNHLFANAEALLFAGLYFEGAEAERWADTGARILCEQLDEQILEDGAQFELSTMYHALALEDLLDIGNIVTAAQISPRGDGPLAMLARRWTSIVERMQRWLAAMSHPDGEIALFNDAAFGIAPAPSSLYAYAARLGISGPGEPAACTWMKLSGYVRASMSQAVLITDIARVGPDYLPGHAHADTLSFELSIGGERILVNGGTSEYGTSEERLRQRGTAAHNTVALAHTDSSEVWSGFRVGRRARPVLAEVQCSEGSIVIRGAHDGYVHFPGRPLHERTWRLTEEGLVVEDIVSSDTAAEAHFLFHPATKVDFDASSGLGSVTRSDGRRVEFEVGAGAGSLRPASYHPRFGESVASVKLVNALCGGRSTVSFRWQI